MAVNPEQGGAGEQSLQEQIANIHLAFYLLSDGPARVEPATVTSEPKPELVVTNQDTEEYGVNVD